MRSKMGKVAVFILITAFLGLTGCSTTTTDAPFKDEAALNSSGADISDSVEPSAEETEKHEGIQGPEENEEPEETGETVVIEEPGNTEQTDTGASETEEHKSYDSGDLYCAFVAEVDNEDDYNSLENKFFEGTGGYLFLPTVYTSDYSGFDSDQDYVVTTWVYSTRQEAEDELEIVKKLGFPDACVMNIGKYRGDNFWVQLNYSGNEEIEVLEDRIILHNAAVFIPHMFSAEPVIMDLTVDKNTDFPESGDMEYAGNYEKGMSVYEWLADSYDLKENDTEGYRQANSPLDGFLEVSLEGDHIELLYSAFYWDV
ncbi:MAG: hypothetical protein K5886_01015 [Lachnospiraceae bacterium]|nr:hypothetical protein [Lachnospiraceae bacterium]